MNTGQIILVEALYTRDGQGGMALKAVRQAQYGEYQRTRLTVLTRYTPHSQEQETFYIHGIAVLDTLQKGFYY